MAFFDEASVAPGWCELKKFTRFHVASGQSLRLPIGHAKARVLVTAGGWCDVRAGNKADVLRPLQFIDIEPGKPEVELHAVSTDSSGVVLEGDWGDAIGGCGVFEYGKDTPARFTGDEVPYEKTTTFDSHYHDHDEYFLILEGHARVVVGDEHRDVKTGDAVAIGMGWHHDMPHIFEAVRAVYFHSRLEGKRRPGHLWNHCHGCAAARMDRR